MCLLCFHVLRKLYFEKASFVTGFCFYHFTFHTGVSSFIVFRQILTQSSLVYWSDRDIRYRLSVSESYDVNGVSVIFCLWTVNFIKYFSKKTQNLQPVLCIGWALNNEYHGFRCTTWNLVDNINDLGQFSDHQWRTVEYYGRCLR